MLQALTLSVKHLQEGLGSARLQGVVQHALAVILCSLPAHAWSAERVEATALVCPGCWLLAADRLLQ